MSVVATVAYILCGICRTNKSPSDFTNAEILKTNTGRKTSRCKSCRSLEALTYRARNNGKMDEYRKLRTLKDPGWQGRASKEWKGRNHDKHKLTMFVANLKRGYGITPEAYGKLLREQEGCCAICKTHLRFGIRLVVDHCHKSGMVRGLLCDPCNHALHFYEDRHKMIAYLEYLERASNGRPE